MTRGEWPFVIRELNNGDIGLYWISGGMRQFLVRMYRKEDTYVNGWQEQVLDDAEGYLRERGLRTS